MTASDRTVHTGGFRRRRPVRAAAAVAALLALLVTGCTGDRTGRDTDGPTGTVTWEPCPDTPVEAMGDLIPAVLLRRLTADLSYDCATLQAPLNWDDPDGDTVEIALVRIRHPEQVDRIGSLVVNPGGPGASGVDHAAIMSLYAVTEEGYTALFERFDVVGFDPRGVGRSSPVRCWSDEQLDIIFATEPDPAGAEVDRQFDEQLRDYRACYDKYGDALTYYSTHQTARDLDAIRAALGDEQLTYLGYSYGTLLGAVYAHLFPEQVRAMVLDGPVDPARDIVADTRADAEAFERAYHTFVSWCREHPRDCPISDDPHEAITRAMAEARTNPAVGSGRQADAGWVFTAVIATLYGEELWPQLGTAVNRLLTDRDPDGIFEIADLYVGRSPDGAYTNLWDANTVISCAERREHIPVEQARRLHRQWRTEFPFFGGPMAWSTLVCTGWPADTDPYPYGKAVGAPPILVVGTTGDPATPVENAEKLADVLGVGVTLTYKGNRHTAYPVGPCVDEAVEAYLIDLDAPEDGTVCGG